MRKIILGMVVVYFVMMTAAAYGADRVCMYEHTNYKGNEFCINDTFLELPDLNKKNMWGMFSWNDQISSIRIEGSLTATVYDHTDYNGENLAEGLELLKAVIKPKVMTFTENVPDLNKVGWNDIISSIRISNCDFSDRKNVKEQKCFGVSGPQCGIPDGVDPKHPVHLNFKTCTADGYATVGSIMHDNCCMLNLDRNGNAIGYMCKKGDFAIGGNDTLVCGYEWNKAFQDSSNNRGWVVVKMGPYTKKGEFDKADLAPEGPREGCIYDTSHWGQSPSTKAVRTWVTEQKDPSWDGHKNWDNVQETVVTRRLMAPTDTPLQYSCDKEFCKSGKWAAGKCQ